MSGRKRADPFPSPEDDRSNRTPPLRPNSGFRAKDPTVEEALGIERVHGHPSHASSEELEDLRTLLLRFEAHDFIGALALADKLFDPARIPVHLGGQATTGEEEGLLSLMDGEQNLETVFQKSGVTLVHALRTFANLVERGVVGFR